MYIKKSASPFFVILLSIVLLGSCMPGSKQAISFMQKRQQVAVMVVPPTHTYLYYYPIDATEDMAAGDSTILKKSFFLHNPDLKRQTDIFLQSMYDQLRSYNLNVYTHDQFEQFLAYEGPRYIFSIAQTEIVESDKPFTDRTLIDTIIYRQDFLIRSLERNTWFEFVEVDIPEEQVDMKVLYSTFSIEDKVNGRFRYRGMTGEVYYEYNAQLLQPQDIDELNQIAGRGNARYIFEYLLNRYIQENRKSSLAKNAYFKYNQRENSIYISKDDSKFLILEPEEIIIE